MKREEQKKKTVDQNLIFYCWPFVCASVTFFFSLNSVVDCINLIVFAYLFRVFLLLFFFTFMCSIYAFFFLYVSFFVISTSIYLHYITLHTQTNRKYGCNKLCAYVMIILNMRQQWRRICCCSRSVSLSLRSLCIASSSSSSSSSFGV